MHKENEKNHKSLVTIAGVLAENRTEDLPKTSLKPDRYTIPFDSF
jgi:hypothetical protein